ncbi:MAG: hypothetical protein RLZZ227_685 [Pseudomonadota bacterium]
MKKLLISIGAVLTLLLIVGVGLIAYVLTFDPNENKEWISAKFRENTGRELVLGGDVEWTLYPWLGITANAVSVGNAPGFSATPLAQAEHLAARVKLMPLLNGEYEIDTVRLHGANLNLEVRGDGANNWTLQGAAEAPVDEVPAPDEGGASVPNFIIGGVDIEDAALVYDDQSTGTHYEVSNFDGSIGALVYGAPLDVRMNFDAASRAPRLAVSANVAGTVLYDIDNGRYNLAPLTLEAMLTGPTVPTGSADIDLSTALTIDLDADTLSLRDLQLTALDTRVLAGVEAARISSDAPSINASLNVTGNDLATIFRIIEQNELAQRIGSLSSNFSIEATIDADMQTGAVNVPTLQANLLGADINGTLTASRINSDAPAVSGFISAAGPDLPTLVEVLGMLQSGSDGELTRIGRDLARVSDKNFRVQTNFSADMDAGTVQVPALSATLLGFTLNGKLDARGINEGGNIDGAFTLEGDKLGEVLTALGQANLGAVAQSLSLDVQLSGSSDNLRVSPLNLALVVAGEQIPDSPQVLALNADTALNLDNDSLSVDTFTLTGLGLNLSGNIVATNIRENAAFEGSIDVPTFDAHSLLQQLNQTITTTDPNVLKSVAFSSGFSGTTNSVALDALQVKLDDSNLSGSLTLNDLQTLSGQFDLDIDSIDADRYLNPVVEETPDDAPASAAEAEPLPVDTLKTLNLKGTLNIAALTISGLVMRDIVVELNAANGNVALNPIRANLYEGSFAGDITLDVNGAQPVATANTTLSTIALGPLLMDFMDSSLLTGTGNLRLALTGSGADSATIRRSLSGNGELGVSDGVLSGVDVDAVLRTLEAIIRSRSMQTLPQGGSTSFEQFAATLVIDTGRISSNDLTISAPGWNVTGAGTLADLSNDTIDFDLVTTVDETPAANGQPYELGGYSLPIACTGSLTGPRCLPDAEQIIASAVTSAVQRRLGDLLQDRLGGTAQQGTTPDATEAAPDQQAPATETAPAEDAEEPATRPEQDLLNRTLDRILR